MKNTFAFVLALALAAPLGGVAPAIAQSSSYGLCAPDAPAGYKRPGGFCDHLDDKRSLLKPGGDSDCDYQIESMAGIMLSDQRIQLADNCYLLDIIKVAI